MDQHDARSYARLQAAGAAASPRRLRDTRRMDPVTDVRRLDRADNERRSDATPSGAGIDERAAASGRSQAVAQNAGHAEQMATLGTAISSIVAALTPGQGGPPGGSFDVYPLSPPPSPLRSPRRSTRSRNTSPVPALSPNTRRTRDGNPILHSPPRFPRTPGRGAAGGLGAPSPMSSPRGQSPVRPPVQDQTPLGLSGASRGMYFGLGPKHTLLKAREQPAHYVTMEAERSAYNRKHYPAQSLTKPWNSPMNTQPENAQSNTEFRRGELDYHRRAKLPFPFARNHVPVSGVAGRPRPGRVSLGTLGRRARRYAQGNRRSSAPHSNRNRHSSAHDPRIAGSSP